MQTCSFLSPSHSPKPNQQSRRCLWLSMAAIVAVLELASPAMAQDQPKRDAAAEIYFGANELYNRKLYELAADEYKAFLKKAPTHAKVPDAQFGLALSYFGMQKFDLAEPVLAKLAADKKAPKPEQVHLFWGQALLRLNKAADAETAYRQGLKLPGAAEMAALKIGLLESLFAQKKWKEVIPASDELAKQKGTWATRAKFQGALARFETSLFKEAGAALDALTTEVKGTAFEQQTHFLLGEAQRELGNFKAAATAYETAARQVKGPFAAEALFRLGFVRFENLKDYEKSAADFGEFRITHKDAAQYAQAGVYLGRAHLEEKVYVKAENVFADLVKDAAAPLDAVLWQARTFSRQKKYDAAAQALAQAETKFAKDARLPELLFDLGNNQYALNKHTAAAAAFSKLITDHPNFAQIDDALRLNADALHRDKKYQASHDLCAKYLVKHSDRAEAGDVAFLQAENLFLLEKYDEAMASFKTFTTKYASHPQAGDAQYRVGNALYNKKQWADALKALEPLTAKKDVAAKFATLDFLIGDAHYRSDAWGKAVVHLNRFAAANAQAPNVDAALLLSGLASQRDNDSAAAIVTLNKLVTAHAGSKHLPHALVEIGRLHYQAKALVNARTALETVVAKHAQSEMRPDAEYYLGFVARDENKRDEAAKQFALVADNSPKHAFAADARFQQGLVSLDKADFAAAQTAISKLLADYPQYANIDQALFRLGMALERQKKWDEALSQYAKVIAMPKSEWSDNALYQSAWCELDASRPDKAAAVYKQLLKDFPKSELADRGSFELAELEFKGGKYDDTLARLGDLLKTTKDAELIAKGGYRLAWAHFEKADMAKAAAAFDGFVSTLPAEPAADLKELVGTAAYQAGEAHMQLAQTATTPAAKAKAHKSALASYTKAVAAKSGDVKVQSQALLRLGECNGLLEEWVASEKVFRQFMQAYPEHALIRNAWHGAGSALESQGKFADALVLFEKVTEGLRKDELGARTQFQVGDCHLKQAQKTKDAEAKQTGLKDAVRAFVYLQANYPPEASNPKGLWHARALLSMATALDESGNKEAAQSSYRELVEKYPDSDSAKAAKGKLN